MDRLVVLVAPAIGAIRMTAGDKDLRRLLGAWLAVNAGKWALLVTTLVLAYEAGGAGAVGILGLARFLTPTLVAPFAGLPTARWRPEVVLGAVSAVRTAAVALLVAMVAADLPIGLLYLAVALEAGVGAFTRPLHMALLPAVARTPAQLVAANVSSSAAEGLGTFAGPAAASILLVTVGPVGAGLAVVAAYAVSVAIVAGLHVPMVGASSGSAREVLAQLSAGVGAVAHHPGPGLIVLDLGLQTFVRGLLTVLVVVAAIDLLAMGEAGVGSLNAAMGLGGMLGAALAIVLAGRRSLAGPFVVALAGWGAPIALIGLADPVIALLAMMAVGIANSMLDVAGFTLVQRLTPNDRRVAVLGLVDSVANGGVALGGLLAPIMVAAVGVEQALLVTGLLLPAAAVATWPLVRSIDRASPDASHRAELIRADPLFAPLSLATVEHLAARLQPLEFADGAWLMREGEPGHEYLLVDHGTVVVERGGQHVRTLGAGSGVGEIALLHAVPRTASVRAVGPVTALALDSHSFREAITGHRVARDVAADHVRQRLAADG